MSKQQPEITENGIENVQITRDVEDKSLVNVIGNWENILEDSFCQTPKTANILYKSDIDEDVWRKEMLAVNDRHFNVSIQLTNACLDYVFKLEIIGFPGTDPIIADIESNIQVRIIYLFQFFFLKFIYFRWLLKISYGPLI